MEENKRIRLQYFFDNYDLIQDFTLDNNKKIYLGNKTNQTCRFCGKMAPEVYFRKEAHAIPELIGNKLLFTYYECDSCNAKFSNLENNFGNYLSAWRPLAQIRGKNGIPSFKRNNYRIDFEDTGLKVKDNIDDPMFKIDEVNKTLTLKTRRDSYVPIAVYKCLTKMALTIMPENELDKFKWAIEWILEEDHINSRFKINPLNIFVAFTPGPKPYPFIKTLIFRRKNSVQNVPYVIYVVAFNNFLYQIYLQDFDKINGSFSTPLEVACLPPPFPEDFPYGKTTLEHIDFSSRELKKGEEIEINMHFEDIYEDEKSIESIQNEEHQLTDL